METIKIVNTRSTITFDIKGDWSDLDKLRDFLSGLFLFNIVEISFPKNLDSIGTEAKMTITCPDETIQQLMYFIEKFDP
jgi:hypothetical protein